MYARFFEAQNSDFRRFFAVFRGLRRPRWFKMFETFQGDAPDTQLSDDTHSLPIEVIHQFLKFAEVPKCRDSRSGGAGRR